MQSGGMILKIYGFLIESMSRNKGSLRNTLEPGTETLWGSQEVLSRSLISPALPSTADYLCAWHREAINKRV